jgi:hypothetical protein
MQNEESEHLKRILGTAEGLVGTESSQSSAVQVFFNPIEGPGVWTEAISMKHPVEEDDDA